MIDNLIIDKGLGKTKDCEISFEAAMSEMSCGGTTRSLRKLGSGFQQLPKMSGSRRLFHPDSISTLPCFGIVFSSRYLAHSWLEFNKVWFAFLHPRIKQVIFLLCALTIKNLRSLSAGRTNFWIKFCLESVTRAQKMFGLNSVSTFRAFIEFRLRVFVHLGGLRKKLTKRGFLILLKTLQTYQDDHKHSF